MFLADMDVVLHTLTSVGYIINTCSRVKTTGKHSHRHTLTEACSHITDTPSEQVCQSLLSCFEAHSVLSLLHYHWPFLQHSVRGCESIHLPLHLSILPSSAPSKCFPASQSKDEREQSYNLGSNKGEKRMKEKCTKEK